MQKISLSGIGYQNKFTFLHEEKIKKILFDFDLFTVFYQDYGF